MFKKRIYMDYAAGGPEIREATRARRSAEKVFANASSIHKDGVAARKIVEESRATIAALMHAHADEIVFTASGTESDNIAIMGAYARAAASGAFPKPHIVTMATEHPAVLERYKVLEQAGAEVSYVPIGPDGLVDPKEVRSALRPETVIVSIMYANNEIGTIQPVREIAKEIRHFKKHSGNPGAIYPLFHTDACQAAPYLTIDVEQLGIDLLSLSGIKLGAGHGAAVLYVRRGTPIDPIMYGGEQEHGLRPGTENVPAIAALSAAYEAAEKNKEARDAWLAILQDYFFEEVARRMPPARINGSRESRLPNNVHISFPNLASELVVLELDARGISASAGSACSASEQSESPVLAAFYGAGDGKKWGSVRFTFGPKTTKREVDRALDALAAILKKYGQAVSR